MSKEQVVDLKLYNIFNNSECEIEWKCENLAGLKGKYQTFLDGFISI